MPRYKNKINPALTDYKCDYCKEKCGGGHIMKRFKRPALVFCKTECKELYFKENNK